MSTESDAINRLREDYIAAANSGDVNGWMATLTDDAVFLPPNEPAVVGQEAIRSWVRAGFFDPYYILLDFTYDEIEIAGSWAFVRGPFNMKLTPKAEAQVVDMTGKFIDILQRQSDGSWKYARVIFNTDTPMGGSQ